LGAQNGRFFIALNVQDGGLTLALGHSSDTGRQQHHRASGQFGYAQQQDEYQSAVSKVLVHVYSMTNG
jgi:hypothetical protein